MLRYRFARLIANAAAALSRSKRDRQEVRERIVRRLLTGPAWFRLKAPRSDVLDLATASRLLQDHAFPRGLEQTRKLIAVLVPERNIVNGGILSLFTFAAELRRQKAVHGCDVVVATRPQAAPITHFRNTNFTNAENVFRFPQLLRCANLEELIVLLPEYSAHDFAASLSRRERSFLTGLKRLRIHILNQNIDAMPPPEDVADLFSLTPEVTLSVGHHGSYSPDMADRYRMPLMLMVPHADLTPYPSRVFAEKEKLVIYSPDDAPWKKACLAAVAAALPDFELREIRGISFDAFMDLAARCMFSMTFGEGFDGYFVQPMQKGGIGFSVFNDRFFPSAAMASYPNLFTDPADMIARIGDVMGMLRADPARYDALSAEWCETIESLYRYEDFRERVSRLVLGRYDVLPGEAASTASGAKSPSDER